MLVFNLGQLQTLHNTGSPLPTNLLPSLLSVRSRCTVTATSLPTFNWGTSHFSIKLQISLCISLDQTSVAQWQFQT